MTAPRLHVLTATDAETAVVLRRGPTDVVASMGWNRGADEFEMGQWVRGRIYEHRADLSPDGRHMIYFVYRGAQSRGVTVLSRAPWLRAIAAYPQSHTWHGGGAFTEEDRVFLNGSAAREDLPDGLLPALPDALPHGTDGFHMGALYAATQVRRGWRSDNVPSTGVGLWRDLSNGWKLEQTIRIGARNRALLSSAYALVKPGVDRRDMPAWTWADVWRDGLHYAADGGLWFARVSADGSLSDTREIHDFSSMSFEAIAAPYDRVEA